jgi:hypothetical protein
MRGLVLTHFLVDAPEFLNFLLLLRRQRTWRSRRAGALRLHRGVSTATADCTDRHNRISPFDASLSPVGWAMSGEARKQSVPNIHRPHCASHFNNIV